MNHLTGKRYEKALVWFRRDLRDHDHAALHHALKEARQVSCVFVFDSEILDLLPDRRDRRVEFIWLSIKELVQALDEMGGELHVLAGSARDVIPEMAGKLGVQTVYANHDYERRRMCAMRMCESGIQSQKFDARGTFIRMYLPELAGVHAKFVHEPWTMTTDEQREAGVLIGKDYPGPIVDHATARKRTLEIYAALR
jgi:deoxyribodipyrimidine photolyase